MNTTAARLASVLLLVAVVAVPGQFLLASAAAPTDDVFSDQGVTLRPSEGANGDYASINDQGNLTVDITNPGVNDESLTVIQDVFVMENTGSENRTVWITHDANDSVTLYRTMEGGLVNEFSVGQRAIDGSEGALTLAPGEQISVSMAINTRGSNTAAGDTILRTITLQTRINETPPGDGTGGQPGAGSGGGNSGAPGAGAGDGNDTDDNDTGDIPVGADDVAAETDTGEAIDVSVEEVNPTSLSDSGVPGEEPPTAVISDRARFGGLDETDDPGPSRVDIVTGVGETVEFTGTESLIKTTRGIDRNERIVKAVNITVPRRFENGPASVSIRIDKDRLGDTAPEDARIGRLTSRGWQLLETTVASETDDSVVLRTRTPGFSVFAVFQRPEVTYTWTLPDGTTVNGDNVRTAFDEPGIYNVTLTVTDSDGDSDTTTRRIVVNDDPVVEIDRPENVSTGETVTLTANVTDEVGNATVRWELPNGTEATGESVNYTFSEGTQTVRAVAEDEYGANDSDEAVIVVGAATRGSGGDGGTVVGEGFPVLEWLVVLTGALAAFSLLAYYRLPAAIPSPVPLVGRLWQWILADRRRRPDVIVCTDISWDADRNLFRIGRLEIEAFGAGLDRVELDITDEVGETLGRKRIDVEDVYEYESAPELVPGFSDRPVRPNAEFTVRVRAVDDRNAEDIVRRVVAPGPESAVEGGVESGRPAD
ncbi:PKD domain-containing protein [Halobaculum magnesiiphilum]|uniref:PKD domain-containing protein n=1 Tax=Halobaculum magnesiiphilum TaxID=1017351 RepID=A0A8T8WE69_9EURY|nr:PKD domain-containing protein [Halobaculum magnesiiphilum]QZP38131.1 PKD domain-containing protein [Halobaculum magnesiiphilum]